MKIAKSNPEEQKDQLPPLVGVVGWFFDNVSGWVKSAVACMTESPLKKLEGYQCVSNETQSTADKTAHLVSRDLTKLPNRLKLSSPTGVYAELTKTSGAALSSGAAKLASQSTPRIKCPLLCPNLAKYDVISRMPLGAPSGTAWKFVLGDKLDLARPEQVKRQLIIACLRLASVPLVQHFGAHGILIKNIGWCIYDVVDAVSHAKALREGDKEALGKIFQAVESGMDLVPSIFGEDLTTTTNQAMGYLGLSVARCFGTPCGAADFNKLTEPGAGDLHLAVVEFGDEMVSAMRRLSSGTQSSTVLTDWSKL